MVDFSFLSWASEEIMRYIWWIFMFTNALALIGYILLNLREKLEETKQNMEEEEKDNIKND